MITAELNQSLLAPGQRLSKDMVARVMLAVSKQINTRMDSTVSIAFVSSREMRKLNRIHRGKDKVTDVLSFCLNDDELLGEVLICYDQAARQARELGHSTKDEVVFLIAHGLLHLLGHDHEKSREAKRMLILQTRILESLGIDPRV